MLRSEVTMLTIEDIAHGEIVLYQPFLTAMQDPAAIPTTVQKIVTVGGTMTLAIVFIWVILISISSKVIHISKQVE
jgi:hypothetical protein